MVIFTNGRICEKKQQLNKHKLQYHNLYQQRQPYEDGNSVEGKCPAVENPQNDGNVDSPKQKSIPNFRWDMGMLLT